MRRFNFRSLNHWLLVAAAVAIAGGWIVGYWTLGAGLGFTALCLVGGRSKLSTSQQAAAATGLSTAQLSGSLVDQLIAQGRGALLLRPQIAATLSPVDREAAQ